MRKTLVLVVDRDDDFGVKGKVNTPVVGVQRCIDAATAFGIADPEDSDLNALYAAISVCLELQEEGAEADVALICGDEKVGHRSDMALVSQLNEVLEQLQPESVILVGDGAEDEYIYPIISSRTHVDSVRKVYVKQTPGLEGTFYILTKMMKDPDKRRRFLVPLGLVLMALSLFFLIPAIIVFSMNQDPSQLSSVSGPLAGFFVGAVFMLYGYNIGERWYKTRGKIMALMVGRSTSLIFLALAISVVVLTGYYAYSEINDLYLQNNLVKIIYFVSTMVWPLIIALTLYSIGVVIEDLMKDHTLKLSFVFDCLGLVSLGLAVTGIMDIIMIYIGYGYGIDVGAIEIIAGIALSILTNYVKTRLTVNMPEAATD